MASFTVTGFEFEASTGTLLGPSSIQVLKENEDVVRYSAREFREPGFLGIVGARFFDIAVSAPDGSSLEDLYPAGFLLHHFFIGGSLNGRFIGVFSEFADRLELFQIEGEPLTGEDVSNAIAAEQVFRSVVTSQSLDPSFFTFVTDEDTANGTNFDDDLNGGTGNDTLIGLGRRDTLEGGLGDDFLDGGDGGDRIVFGEGVDTVFGGIGADRLVVVALDGASEVDGGDGQDTLDTSFSLVVSDSDTVILDAPNGVLGLQSMPVSDWLTFSNIEHFDIDYFADAALQAIGGVQDDTLRGGGLADTISGGAGDDSISGSGELRGEGGNDTVLGSGQVFGGKGDDSVSGRGTLSGGEGDDSLFGTGTLSGGAGRDTLESWFSTSDEELRGGDDNDLMFAWRGDDTMFGGNGQDLMYGGSGDDLMNGQAGNDRMFANDGADTMNGGSGVDSILGNKGNDFVFGGAGADTLEGGRGSDVMFGGTGRDLMFGGSENANVEDGGDDMRGGLGNDTMNGGRGQDTMNGGNGADFIQGQVGNDSLLGGTGADRLRGGSESDTLDGEGGADRLDGDNGDDLLTGGLGADVFVFRDGGGQDTITDFELVRDRLELDDRLWSGTLTASDVVETFADDATGDTIFTFDDGETLTLTGIGDKLSLVSLIDIA